MVREVPAPGLADGPVPPGAQPAGIGPWPSTSRQTVRVGPVSATLSVFQPAGAPPALALHVLSFVHAGTAVQITAQGVAHGGATITRLAAGMVPRQADGASWSRG